MGFKKYKKKMSHIKTRYAALRESRSHLKKLGRICLENINPITAPVALISQIQRSGGSLLSQLFDGHSEIYAHPDELMIGHPKKYIWPHINLKESPMRWFNLLFEDNVIKHFNEGYTKGHKSEKTFPFMFLPYLQKIIFLQYLGSIESITQRDIFNAYMTSYFGAWLNHQNNYGPKKFVTGFTPRLAMVQESIELFFSVYPDGRLISIIRDPKNWFPSAHRHRDKKKKYENIESASRQWAENAKAMVKNKEKYGHRVCIIRFENLISDIESVMRHLANFLNIEFDDILLTPTFNKSPITANTSFNAEKPGIVASTLSRYKTLNPQELKIIEKMTKAEYQSVLNKTVNLKESGN
jgi:hypothetical protein